MRNELIIQFAYFKLKQWRLSRKGNDTWHGLIPYIEIGETVHVVPLIPAKIQPFCFFVNSTCIFVNTACVVC